MKLKHWTARALLSLLVVAPCRAAEPAPAAREKPAPLAFLGEPHEQTVAARTLLYTSSDVTFDKIGDAVAKAVPKLAAAQEAGKVRLEGSLVFVYHDPDLQGKPFALDIGVVVATGTQAPEGLKVRTLEPLHCETLLYTGPLNSLASGYEKLMPALQAAKKQPAGEVREYYLYWEGPDSPNNIVQILMAIK